MRKVVFQVTILIFFVNLNSIAQKSTITFFDFLLSSAVNEIEVNSNMKWNEGLSIDSRIKWNSKDPKHFLNNYTHFESYSKEGKASIMFSNNKVYSVGITIQSNTNFHYNEIQFEIPYRETNYSKDNGDYYELEKLIPLDKKYLSHLIASGSHGFTDYHYAVKLPSKKLIWVSINPLIDDRQPSASTIAIDIYTDKKIFIENLKTWFDPPIIENSTLTMKDYIYKIDSIEQYYNNNLNNKNTTKLSSNTATNISSKPITNQQIKTQISPLAYYLFKNTNTKLSTTDKNEITKLTELTTTDTSNLDKKGRPKKEFTVLPLDFNNDGVEEIFVRITSKDLLGIPTNIYSFYVKDQSGHYIGAPGRIGQGAKFLSTKTTGYYDILVKSQNNSSNSEIWKWNGHSYSLIRTISSSDALLFLDKKSIEAISNLYNAK